jgi:hypothetical protein
MDRTAYPGLKPGAIIMLPLRGATLVPQLRDGGGVWRMACYYGAMGRIGSIGPMGPMRLLLGDLPRGSFEWNLMALAINVWVH